MGVRGNGVTALLAACREGDPSAFNGLFEVVYADLRRLAASQRFVPGSGCTLQPTALVNEVYLVLREHLPRHLASGALNRRMFFRAVAEAMRAILRDHYRQEHAIKRGGGRRRLTLDHTELPDRATRLFDQTDFAALDEALDELSRYNTRWYDVVMLRYFAGRSVGQTATLLGHSVPTVVRDWRVAQGWLRRRLRAPEREALAPRI